MRANNVGPDSPCARANNVGPDSPYADASLDWCWTTDINTCLANSSGDTCSGILLLLGVAERARRVHVVGKQEDETRNRRFPGGQLLQLGDRSAFGIALCGDVAVPPGKDPDVRIAPGDVRLAGGMGLGVTSAYRSMASTS
jgi:hypothetical protein